MAIQGIHSISAMAAVYHNGIPAADKSNKAYEAKNKKPEPKENNTELKPVTNIFNSNASRDCTIRTIDILV